jgi:sterol-4alpha-carboxylate 3-dehydrogenase (decarboxylating)
VFFITNDEPIQFWDFADYLWKGLGYPTPKIGIPFLLMYWIAVLVAFIVKILAPIIEIRPAFTPLRVCAAGTERTFNIDKAKKMLGYKPIVSLEEGMKRSLEWLKEEVKSGRLENVY